jgi:N6-L-threonylcarbamoyladenine synthase
VEAARAQGVGDVVLSGGVAANSRLRERFAAAASEAGMRAHLTRREYCTDNAAMIAGAAIPKPLLPREEQLALEPFASGHLAPAI